MEVDDHITGLAAPIEQLVDGRERLHRPLQRPERKRGAAGKYERSQRVRRSPDRPHDHCEQQPEGGEHRDSGAHDQKRVQGGCLLRLLRGQAPVDDEPALV